MEQRKYKPTTTKKTLCVLLSLIMAFGTFLSMTVDNILPSDIIDLRNMIVAEASTPTPKFYRYGELVGLYTTDNSGPIKYSINDNEHYTDYIAPFSITAFNSTTIYAKIGENGDEVYKDYSTTNKALGVYTESATDFDFSYNGIDFGYTRTYNSADKDWFESIHSKVVKSVLKENYLEVYLPDGTMYPLIKTSQNTYTDELTGNTAVKTNNEYIFDDGEYKYHFGFNNQAYLAYLSGIEDNNGNVLNLTRTTNIEEASISDGTRTFALSVYHAVQATNDPDVNYYSVKTITDPNNNDIEYTTKWGRYIQVKDQAGVTLGKYQYVSTANDYTLTKSNDKTIEYYTASDNVSNSVIGRLKKITYDNGSWVQYTYTDNDKTYTTLTSSGETTCTVYNDAFLPVSYTDEYGTTTTYTYDNKFQVTQEVVENETTTYTYDGSGHLLTMTVRGVEENSDTTYTYDNNGNVIHEQCDNSHNYYTYDSNKNVLVSATLKEDYEGEIPTAYDSSLTCFDTIVYTYDSSGRVLTETNSNGESSAYVYDSVGNITQETVTTIENGTPTTTVTNYTYDDLGNLLTSQTGNENSSYTYDAAGRTLLANEGGDCTRTLYDNQGRVVQEIGPEDYDSSLDGLPTANTYSDSTAGHTYVYDSTTGNLTSETNRLGVQTDYTYYSTGEKATEEFDIYKFCYNEKGLTTEVYVDDVNTVQYNYDDDLTTLLSTEYANGQKERYDYDNDGNLKYQYHNNNTTPYLTYSYDEDGELEEKVNTDTGLRYEYDGNDVEVYKTSNNTLIHSYSEEVTEADEENEIEARTDVTQSGFGTTTTSALVGNSITYTRGNTTLEYSHTDNSDNQVTADAIKYNNDTALSNQYIYDNDGNLVRQKNHQCLDNGQPLTVNYRYDYDSKDRIVGKGYSGIEYFNHYDSKGQLVREDYRLSGSDTYTYTYDSRGNITSKKTYNYTTGSLDNATPTNTKTFTYANSGWTDRLTAVDNDTLTYDSVGNVLTYGNRSFTWSAGRNLAQVTEGTDTYSYTYDENGIRTSKTVNGVTTQYNTKDGVILAQSDGTNTLTFQYDTEGHPLGYTYNGTQYLYMVNVQGDVFGVANTDGMVIGAYDYDEWGNPTDSYTAENATTAEVAAFNANPLRYRGYYYDQETGYYYLQSRYYDPSICRFINSDLPEYAQEQKTDYVGLNIFAYCCNDAVNNVDYVGYSKESKHKINLYTIKKFYKETCVVKNNLCDYFYVNDSSLSILSDGASFIRAWNSSTKCDVAVVNCHGDYNAIGRISRNSVLKLKKKSIKVLILLSCNAAGMRDENDNDITFANIASAFAQLLKNTVVVASNGEVYSNHLVPRKSHAQHKFRSEKAWYIYKNNKCYSVKKDVRKVITMKKILEYLVRVGFIKW